MIDTGVFTPGARAPSSRPAWRPTKFVQQTRQVIYKQQYNARIYQPIGSNGDFISIAGHYNQNRNNFCGSLPLRNDTIQCQPVAARRPRRSAAVASRFPRNTDEREYDINRFPLTRRRPRLHDRALPTSDVARPTSPMRRNGCGTEFERRYNPSNTGNIRGHFALHAGAVSSSPSIRASNM